MCVPKHSVNSTSDSGSSFAPRTDTISDASNASQRTKPSSFLPVNTSQDTLPNRSAPMMKVSLKWRLPFGEAADILAQDTAAPLVADMERAQVVQEATAGGMAGNDGQSLS